MLSQNSKFPLFLLVAEKDHNGRIKISKFVFIAYFLNREFYRMISNAKIHFKECIVYNKLFLRINIMTLTNYKFTVLNTECVRIIE